MTQIRTASGLLALDIGTRVKDKFGDVWTRDEEEREWLDTEGFHDVLRTEEWADVQDLGSDEYTGHVTAFAKSCGPFEVLG